MQTPQFNIEIRDIDSIRPYDNNPRKNDQAVDAVAGSLREYGFRQPIVVDSNGVVIADHIAPVLTDGEIFTDMLHHEPTVGDAIFPIWP